MGGTHTALEGRSDCAVLQNTFKKNSPGSPGNSVSTGWSSRLTAVSTQGKDDCWVGISVGLGAEGELSSALLAASWVDDS